MPQRDSIPKTEIAAKLQREMNERDLTIDDLRKIAETQFETARRYVRGLNVPSPAVLKLLSNKFEWNHKEVQMMLVRDQLGLKYGDLLHLSQGIDPDAHKFVKAWPLLNTTQRKALLQQLNDYAKQNKS